MNIDRRTLLAGGAALGAGAAFGLRPSSALAAQKLTGVTYLPPSYEDLAYGSQGFVDFLSKNHADQVTVDFYDSGRLLSADEQLPALRAGTIDFMFHTTSYITRSLPILGVMGLPGVVGPLYENPDRLKRGSPLFTLIEQELKKKGLTVLSLGGGILEPEYIWSAGDPGIRTLDAIDGKRIRVVSFEATKAIEDFKGASVRVPSSELYLALQRGTVDAAVANISTINGRSIQEQVKQVLRVPVTAFAIGVFVQTDRFEAMPKEVKTAMTEAAEWFDDNSARAANKNYYDAKYWPKFKEGGLQVVEPDKAMLDRFADVSGNVRTAWTGEVGEEIGKKAIALAMGEQT